MVSEQSPPPATDAPGEKSRPQSMEAYQEQATQADISAARGKKQLYNKYVVCCTLLASLNCVLLGYDIGVMSGALLYIKDDFKLSNLKQEILVGSLNLVSLVGGIIAGPAADAFGRRKTMAIAAAIFLIGALVLALAPSFTILMAGRVISGIGVGFAMIVAPVYTAELAPPGSRGSLVSFAEVFINTGILMGYVANFALSPLPVPVNWRLMLGLGGVPSIFLAAAVLVMPESPRWLVVQNQIEDARMVLLKTCGGDKQEAELRLAAIVESLGDEYEVEEQNELQPVKADPEAAGQQQQQSIPPVIKKNRRKDAGVWRQLLWPSAPVRRMLVVSLGVHFFQQASGVDALVYYSPAVFHQAGIKSRTSVLGMTIAVGLTKTLFILVGTIWLDSVGRRPLLLASATGMTLALTTVAVTFKFLHVSAHGDTAGGARGSVGLVALAMLGICGFMASFSVGFGPTVYVLASEIFPLTLRARAMSLSMAMNRGVSATVTLTFLSLASAITTSNAFFVFAGIAAASIVFVTVRVPETKGKSLEEVCKYFGWEPSPSDVEKQRGRH